MDDGPIKFLLDEHLRGPLLKACDAHNRESQLKIDVVSVGDFDDLPIGTQDPEILRWAEVHGRVLITRDKRTMPGHLRDHLAAGRSSPGVLIVRPGLTISYVVEFLACIAHASDAYEWIDRVEFIP